MNFAILPNLMPRIKNCAWPLLTHHCETDCCMSDCTPYFELQCSVQERCIGHEYNYRSSSSYRSSCRYRSSGHRGDSDHNSSGGAK